jgi:hypothetical protein
MDDEEEKIQATTQQEASAAGLLVAALFMVLAGVAIIIGLTVWPALDTGAPSTSPPEATE